MFEKGSALRANAAEARRLLTNFRLAHLRALSWYCRDYRTLRRQGNPSFGRFRFAPYLDDKTAETPLDPVYFFQNAWMAAKLFNLKPSHHVDVGSSANALGMLSQFTRLTMVDIRPLPLRVPGLEFVRGSITALPFADASLPSVSSLCVVEHIGLGRYGDEVDAFGSEKALRELQRVTAPGGRLMISLPVDRENTIYFNAHRAFTRETVLSLFSGFELAEEKYQYGYELGDRYDPERGFGTGLYLFRRRT